MTSSSSEWFIVIESQKVGPISREDVIYRFLQAAIDEDTLVWEQGMADWQPLKATGLMDECKKARDLKYDPAVASPELRIKSIQPAAPKIPKRAVPVSYTGFWARFLAYTIDSIVLYIVSVSAQGSVQALLGVQDPKQMGLIMVSFQILSGFFYYAIVQGILSFTVGKAVVGARLVREDLTPVTLGQSVKRYFCWILVSIPFCLGLILAAWNPRKQGWHDRLAKTLVVPKDVAA